MRGRRKVLVVDALGPLLSGGLKTLIRNTLFVCLFVLFSILAGSKSTTTEQP